MNVERIVEGFGLIGAIGHSRLESETAGSGCPDSLIVKLSLAQTGQTSLYRKRVEHGAPRIGPCFQRCAREVRFYDELAPLGLAPAPTCYFAASSEEQAERAILSSRRLVMVDSPARSSNWMFDPCLCSCKHHAVIQRGDRPPIGGRFLCTCKRRRSTALRLPPGLRPEWPTETSSAWCRVSASFPGCCRYAEPST